MNPRKAHGYGWSGVCTAGKQGPNFVRSRSDTLTLTQPIAPLPCTFATALDPGGHQFNEFMNIDGP